jgi:TDG/mug DNA glycosylase family protein
MLADLLEPKLTVVFVGTSVSEASARAEHYYADPRNRFWDLLDATGLTADAGLTSARDREVLEHGIGITDLVKGRAASSDRHLSDHEYDVEGFLARVRAATPEIIAFNGLEAARRVARELGRAAPPEGPLPWRVAGARAYRLPSSSSANARGGYARKLTAWREFGKWARAEAAR